MLVWVAPSGIADAAVRLRVCGALPGERAGFPEADGFFEFFFGCEGAATVRSIADWELKKPRWAEDDIGLNSDCGPIW